MDFVEFLKIAAFTLVGLAGILYVLQSLPEKIMKVMDRCVGIDLEE